MYSEKLLINHLSVELGLGLQTRTDIRWSMEDISDSDSDLGPQTKKTTRDELGITHLNGFQRNASNKVFWESLKNSKNHNKGIHKNIK